jgi:hypothetical protein
MAVEVFVDGFITVAGVNLSSRCTKLEVDDGYDEVDLKAMSNTAGNTGVGMKKQSIKATFLQDFAAGSVHPTLQAANGTAVAIVVRKSSAARGPTNPEWTGTLLLSNYSPVNASVGAKQDVPVEFKTIGVAIGYSIA